MLVCVRTTGHLVRSKNPAEYSVSGFGAVTFLDELGIVADLNVRERCGVRPCFCQIRRTLFSLRPAASAMVRVLQWVALSGFSRVVLRITSCTLAGVIVGALPGRGASFT